MFPAGYEHDYPMVGGERLYSALSQALCMEEFEHAEEPAFDLLQGIIDKHGPNAHVGDANVSESIVSYVIAVYSYFFMGDNQNDTMASRVLDLIRYLLAAGALASPGPLTRAAERGVFEIINVLLPYVSNVDDHFPEKKIGYTALCCLARASAFQMSRMSPDDPFSATYKDEARECATLLMSHGADSTCKGSSNLSAWDECENRDHPLHDIIRPPPKSAHV